MSVFNCENYVAAALESILEQTWEDFELIIVNDGSTDHSLDIIKSYRDPRIPTISRENQGLAQSMNEGIRAGTGEYVAQMDADDKSHPERIAKQVEFLDQNQEIGLLGTWAMVITEDGDELCVVKKPVDDKIIKQYIRVLNSPFFDPSVMFRRSLFDAVGSYATPHHGVKLFSSWGLYSGIAKCSKMTNLELPLYTYRLRPTSSLASFSSRERQRLRKLANEMNLDEKLADDVSHSFILNPLRSEDEKLASYYLAVGVVLLEHGQDHRHARRWLISSLSKNPFSQKAWVNFLYSFLPSYITALSKRSWKNWKLRRTQRADL